MLHHRMLILLFAGLLVTGAALAFVSAAQTGNAMIKLVSAQNRPAG